MWLKLPQVGEDQFLPTVILCSKPKCPHTPNITDPRLPKPPRLPKLKVKPRHQALFYLCNQSWAVTTCANQLRSACLSTMARTVRAARAFSPDNRD